MLWMGMPPVGSGVRIHGPPIGSAVWQVYEEWPSWRNENLKMGSIISSLSLLVACGSRCKFLAPSSSCYTYYALPSLIQQSGTIIQNTLSSIGCLGHGICHSNKRVANTSCIPISVDKSHPHRFAQDRPVPWLSFMTVKLSCSSGKMSTDLFATSIC